MAYKGTYTIKNPRKYLGDPRKIVYRSLWERNVMMWLDDSKDVVEWASEEIPIKYYNPIKCKQATYYPDFYVKFKSGVSKIIEVKPLKETIKPETPKRKTKNYLAEVSTFAVNQEKWKAAVEACKDKDTTFEVWTEITLKELGLMKEMYVTKPNVPNIKRRESNKRKLKPVRRAKRKS